MSQGRRFKKCRNRFLRPRLKPSPKTIKRTSQKQKDGLVGKRGLVNQANDI